MRNAHSKKGHPQGVDAQFIFGRRLTSAWLAELRRAVRAPSPIVLEALALSNITLGEVAGALAVGVVPLLDHHYRYVFIEELTQAPLASQWQGLRWLRLDPVATDYGPMSLCVRINQRGLEALITLGLTRLSISGAVTTLTVNGSVPAIALDALVGGPVTRLVEHPLLSSDYIIDEAIEFAPGKCRLSIRSSSSSPPALADGVPPW